MNITAFRNDVWDKLCGIAANLSAAKMYCGQANETEIEQCLKGMELLISQVRQLLSNHEPAPNNFPDAR